MEQQLFVSLGTTLKILTGSNWSSSCPKEKPFFLLSLLSSDLSYCSSWWQKFTPCKERAHRGARKCQPGSNTQSDRHGDAEGNHPSIWFTRLLCWEHAAFFQEAKFISPLSLPMKIGNYNALFEMSHPSCKRQGCPWAEGAQVSK